MTKKSKIHKGVILSFTSLPLSTSFVKRIRFFNLKRLIFLIDYKRIWKHFPLKNEYFMRKAVTEVHLNSPFKENGLFSAL